MNLTRQLNPHVFVRVHFVVWDRAPRRAVLVLPVWERGRHTYDWFTQAALNWSVS